MTATTIVRPADPTLRAALRLAALFAALKLLFTFALTLYTQHLGYSYFRDEFYYIACGHHLAWGYVDHGPIVALQARLSEILFGDSLFAIRIFSATAIAISIFLTGLITWALGGRRPAQALAMFALSLSPMYIAQAGYLSMNSCEPMFWMTSVLALILLQRGHSPRLWWIVLGLSAGIGLLNKPSMTFFLVSIGIGLLLTPQRKLLFTRWAALGIALLILIALPNVLWQVHNHWPTLEFLRDQQIGHKDVALAPIPFFFSQFAMMHPVNALLWITGIVSLLRAKSIRPVAKGNARWLAFAFLIFFVLMCALHAKDYYLAAAYPALFAAGAIAWEHRFAASRSVLQDRIIGFPIFESIILLTALIILPMSSPVLAPATWVRYTTALHLHTGKLQQDGSGPLPQFYADRFGWQQEAGIVLAAYRGLSPADQQRVCIFGNNYGEAASIDFFNRLQHASLPPAISGHNNYYLWGPNGCDANLVIAVIGDTPAAVATKYSSVTIVGHLDDPYAMPYEHKNIYLLRNRRPDAPFLWSDEKHYD
jgi:4-amino-4-deoxy-L-arabinose transferase-like glycosyltransferase